MGTFAVRSSASRVIGVILALLVGAAAAVLIASTGASQASGGRTTTATGTTSKPKCQDVKATIVGTKKRDVIYGTANRDVIVGKAGRDEIHGLGGDDRICPGASAPGAFCPEAQFVYGGGGDDHVFGEPDESGDYFHGGAGDDTLFGYGRAYGDDGNDELSVQPGILVCGGGYRADGGPDSDQVCCSGGEGTGALAGGEGDDLVFAFDDETRLFGGGGDDNMSATAGDDELFGGSGDDYMDASLGTDLCDGNSGVDHALGCETSSNIP